ncbi:MAG: SMEK domain-containing protein [Halarcobacter sp.]
MLSKEHYIEQIKEKIAIFQAKIKLETSLNHHNLKLYGENFFRDILNILYEDSNFENTNFTEGKNFVAIDLISLEKNKCIQITCNRKKEKLVETIKKFKKFPYIEFFKTINHFSEISDTNNITSLDEYKTSFTYLFQKSKFHQYTSFDIEIYYLLEKYKPNKVSDLEEEVGITNLSSKLKDYNDLLVAIENLKDNERIEKIFKLFKVEETFISSFEDAITSIECEIEEISNVPIKTKLNKILVKSKKYFMSNLDLLLDVLKQIDCETNTHKKNPYEKYQSLVKFLSFNILSQYSTNSFKFPTNSNIHLYINNYKSWLFNSSRMIKPLEYHIGKIAEYISLQSNSQIDNGICYLSSLKDKGGMSCDTCIDGFLGNVVPKIDGIVTDFTNSDSTDVLQHHFDFMELKAPQKVEFKCGECISNISDYENAKKII